MNDMSNDYPRTVHLKGKPFEFRLLGGEDRDEMLAFARALPEEDLRFLRVDLTDPKVVDHWIDDASRGLRLAVLAHLDGRLVGYGSLNRRESSWMRHLGEIRIMVLPEVRQAGLGGHLAHDVFQLAQQIGLTKIVAQMAREQRGARQMFHKLGFSIEALLADWVIDPDDATHDLILMSYDVTGLEAGAGA